jgi:very-short-patch-repair endonuclease
MTKGFKKGHKAWNTGKKYKYKSYNLTEEGKEQKIKNLGVYATIGQTPWNKGLKPQGKQNYGLELGREKNKSKECREIQRQRMKNIYKNNPEKHPNRIMARRHGQSKQQYELYLLIKEKYPEAEFEYPIKTNYSWRFADIALPSKKIDIEFDGEYWHQNKLLDDLRTKHLNEIGWKVIRFDKTTIHLCMGELKNV